MNKITFGYGRSTVEIAVDNAKSIAFLKEKDIEEITDLKAYFRNAVTADCVDSAPLNEILNSKDLVTIVISDITRFWMRQDLICRELVDYLAEEIGIAYENMQVVVALGTHRGQTEDELRKIASEEVYARVKVSCHDCLADGLQYVGTTSFGTEVLVNALAVGRRVILIGGTVHHLMAGFGGGRKSVMPGICGKKSIEQNHLLSLDPGKACSSPLIGLGKLADNPLHADMTEACALVGPAFGINIVSNAKGKHCRIICGGWQSAWEESCRAVHETFGVPIAEKADIVIGSCGGFPKDINLYQGVKTLLNMSQAVKDGGTMIFLAQCEDGGGAPDFFDWRESLKTNSLDADLRENFSIAGYIFYACCECISKCNVLMLTDIAPEILHDMKIKAYADSGEMLANVDFAGKSVYIMQNGGSTVPYVKRLYP